MPAANTTAGPIAGPIVNINKSQSDGNSCNGHTYWISLIIIVLLCIGLVILFLVLLLIVLYTDPDSESLEQCGEFRRKIQRKIVDTFKVKAIKL